MDLAMQLIGRHAQWLEHSRAAGAAAVRSTVQTQRSIGTTEEEAVVRAANGQWLPEVI
jgi:hypothetical protein